MYKYKETTDVEVGDLVIWTNPANPSRIIKNKPYRVTGTSGTLVAIQDELGSTILYSNTSRKTLETKPASEAVVGDYMYRITSGTSLFSQHSVIKITEVNADKTSLYNLYYASASCVSFHEVIVIAQAEPEIKYPYFTESKHKGKEYICKILEKEKYIYIYNWVKNGCNKIWDIQPPPGEPCDFTTEPEVFDIDWWQQRFEAGLPVYISDEYGNSNKCNLMPPKTWSKHYTFSMTDPSVTQKTPLSKEDIDLFKYVNAWKQVPLGAATNCSLPQLTIKEQPMKLQQLLDTIFGVSDYEAKPKFIVTVFNNDKEVGTTTAESIEEIQQTIQSDTRLWGCKLVAYKIHSELQTQVPVAITKFKKESNASAE